MHRGTVNTSEHSLRKAVKTRQQTSSREHISVKSQNKRFASGTLAEPAQNTTRSPTHSDGGWESARAIGTAGTESVPDTFN